MKATCKFCAWEPIDILHSLRNDVNRQIGELQSIIAETQKEMARTNLQQVKSDLELRCIILSAVGQNLKRLNHIHSALKDITGDL